MSNNKAKHGRREDGNEDAAAMQLNNGKSGKGKVQPTRNAIAGACTTPVELLIGPGRLRDVMAA